MYEDGVFIPNEISRMKDLDALLRCGICYEYMKTSMITSCSHNYCSLCIRKSLIYKAQCPACFEEAFDYQLRNNRILDDIIEVYVRLSDEIKTFLQKYKILSKTQNKVNTIPDSHLNPNSVSELREKHNTIKKGNFNNVSPARIGTEAAFCKLSDSVNSPTTSSYVPGSEISICNDFVSLEDAASVMQSHQSPDKRKACKGELLIPSMFSPKKKHNTTENLVPCPVCNVDIPEKNINMHLDACLKRSEQLTQNISPSKVQRRRPLPKLVYQLLQEKELRKRLKQQGLSTHGDCKALINRHQRFTLLYNSECDTLNPRATADIIKQIEKEEQEERKVSSAATFSSKFKIDRKTDPKLIEQVQQQYIQQNKSSFDNLIQSIRKRGTENKMEVKQNLVLSDVKDDSAGISGDSDKVQKVAGNKAAIENDIIVSDDNNFTDNGNSMYAPSTSMTPTNKTRLVINVDDIDDTCDMSYEVDTNVSPVLGRNTVANCSTRENERHSGRKSIQNLTLDMFEENFSRSCTQKCSPPGQQTEEVESNVVSDADSNQSFSLLAESTQEAPFKSEQRNIVTKTDEKLSRRMPKRFNSQLDDPDFEPDSEDMLDDFEIRKPPFRRERNTRKSPEPSSSKEVRILRKRVKR